MNKKLSEIAAIVSGKVVGNEDIVIKGLSGIKEASQGDLTFLANSKYFHFVDKTKASAVLVPRDVKINDKPAIIVDNPSLAFSKIAGVFFTDQYRVEPGIDSSAIVSKNAKIGKDVYIGPCAVIEEKASIGEGTSIHAGCFVGYDTSIGDGCTIYANATIRERIKIGDRVIIHSGTVVGSDGFGFVNVDGVHEKIPQIGTVIIGDDVEIGANVTIDRARFDKTIIGSGTKIDNLVQIAHNVVIGENCIIVAQSGIAGSTTVGKNAILAAQSGIVGHLKIGEGAVIYAQSGISKSVEPSAHMFGSPAKPINIARRVNASIQRLPHYVDTINELKKKVEALEKKIVDKNK